MHKSTGSAAGGQLQTAIKQLVKQFGLEVQKLEKQHEQRRTAMDNLRSARGLLTVAENNYRKWRTACSHNTPALTSRAETLIYRLSMLEATVKDLALAVSEFQTLLAAAEKTHAVLQTIGLHGKRAIRGNGRKLRLTKLEFEGYPLFFASLEHRRQQLRQMLRDDGQL